MPTIYDLKPTFQILLRPLSNWLAYRGATANSVTIAALLLSFVMGMTIAITSAAKWALLFVPFILVVRMVLNAIDGMLAREHNMKTKLGTILNEMGDVLSDTFIYLAFCFVPHVSTTLIISIVILAIISEMMGVVAIQIGAKRRYDGPMGKSDRAFVFGVIALLLGTSFQPGPWVNIVLIMVNLLLVITIFNRAARALRG